MVKEEDAKKGNFPTQLIEFDISLNTVLANKVGGGVEVKAVLNMASEHSHNNENLSRAKFCVPITLPCTILKNEPVTKTV